MRELGTAVSKAGDFNGDGLDDIIFGAKRASSNGFANSGRVFVVYGTNSLISSFDLLSLNGRNGFSVDGLRENGYLGLSVSYIGDFNKDGFDDILLAESEGSNNGNAYVIFGSNTPLSSPFDLTH